MPAAADLQRKLSSGQERAYRLGFYITLTAPGEQALELATGRIVEAARAAQFSWKTVERAKKECGVRAVKRERGWAWQTPRSARDCP